MTTATAVAQDRDITVILPTETPTATFDPPQCQTHNLTEYFDYPKPSCALVSTIWSHATKLLKPCSSTAISGIRGCPFPESSDWCNLRTSIPASVLPAYSSYGSSASVWWKSRSSAAFSLAEQCPIGWFKAMCSFSGGATWLNETIIYGGCYAEADPTSGSSALDGPTVTANPTATPGARASTTNAILPTGRPGTNGALDRAKICSLWKAAGAWVSLGLDKLDGVAGYHNIKTLVIWRAEKGLLFQLFFVVWLSFTSILVLQLF
ncbi:hypothetical protein GTR04_0530 [Trichophyton interdigitale]|uniref:DUF7735 domain-containing protein n=1 Tax=Trichophyton interdigitale TaxID=101480 RepID=A0A9P5D0L5_9EURO|nr:hypothetical protein GY631_0342 [Trichophyton interdigitale]KAF3901094.1 hypothetical protein GY632_0209 [Trichophyton interdigitale]KAG8212032.1 hypothetical protein GTR04_0530 [Trichophyton interdigitale]